MEWKLLNKKKGMNMGLIKQENRALILQVLKNNAPISRMDIAKIVQLTPAAITILVNEMIAEKIIIETGEVEEIDKRAGRKKIIVDINYNFRYVLGINIESEVINIGIMNLKGEVVAEDSFTNAEENTTPQEFLKIIANRCINLFWKENILKENILGIGVGIIGLVDKNTGISKRAYGLWKHKVLIKDILELELGIPVVVDNNVRALAIAEMDSGLEQGVSDLLFVKYGPGIGAAMVIGKEIYYGGNNKAGEIGHTVGLVNGELCKCGKRGCLETIASYDAIIKNVKKIFSKEQTPKLYSKCNSNANNITMEKVFEALISGDDEIKSIVCQAITHLTLAISNAISLYDPQRVVLYGEAFENSEFLKNVKKMLREVVLVDDFDNFIKVSKVNNKKNYIGGATLAIREYFFVVGGAI